MSQLYIRVLTGFYTHKKTIRLKIKLGADAFWIPPRLWAYAAENQPDGDLSAYTSEELAELIGFQGNARCNAQALLQALKDSGFIEESGIVHDWQEHNGYHKSFSERAKTASAARWAKVAALKAAALAKKEKSPTPPKEETGYRIQDSGDKHCLCDATSITEDQIYKEYPLKVGKPAALKAIKRAMTKHDPSLLLEKTKAYSRARNGDMAFTPHPSTWFNQERFNDDPATWTKQNGTRPNGQPVRQPGQSVGLNLC